MWETLSAIWCPTNPFQAINFIFVSLFKVDLKTLMHSCEVISKVRPVQIYKKNFFVNS